MDPDAAGLLARTFATLLRGLSWYADHHFEGLCAASRHKSLALSNKQRRQLTHVDIAFNWSRHVTATKCEQRNSVLLGSTACCDSRRDRYAHTCCRTSNYCPFCAHPAFLWRQRWNSKLCPIEQCPLLFGPKPCCAADARTDCRNCECDPTRVDFRTHCGHLSCSDRVRDALACG